jgi:acetoin utilization deacetylase AcuC-like enzyme/GNAT superfamily N-acetyltransferase
MMLRIRRIYDALFPGNLQALEQVKQILREQFPEIKEQDIAAMVASLRDPLACRFRTILFVGEDGRGRVRGFAALSHVPDLRITFLDYVAVRAAEAGSGLGGALYERVREESRLLRVQGLFFECLPADPSLCADRDKLEQNRRRLRFYERFGVTPVVNTEYETPVNASDTCPPHLMYDDLLTGAPLPRTEARKIVRAILERKYAGVCDEQYVARVVASFRDDPVAVRRAERAAAAPRAGAGLRECDRIVLVVNRGHAIHHVRDRGYVEAPVRIASILKEIDSTGLFVERPPRRHSDGFIRQVHDRRFLDYLKRLSAGLEEGTSVYPYVFPIRNAARLPRDLAVRAGYYCIDTFTPLNRNAWAAARGAVDAALTAADAVLEGSRVAYALVRPPGHHAERRAFGGFCYLNSAAVAAQLLSQFGRVAILDLDFHHGNGQQEIFYDRPDVLTVSIHGHPSYAYPYFSGFADEKGDGPGRGFNLNIPLPPGIDGPRYRAALERALRRIRPFAPHYLVVSLGLDTARGDPTGSWALRGGDFALNGSMVGSLGLPTLVVQEGGYDNRVLGTNARRFFTALHAAAFGSMTGASSAPAPAARAAPARRDGPTGAEGK